MPSAPLLKVRTTGRSCKRRATPLTSSYGNGASDMPNGTQRNISVYTMPKKGKGNASVSNGTAASTKSQKKESNGVLHGKTGKNKKQESASPLLLQISAAVLVIIIAVVFIQTDFLKFLGSKDKAAVNSRNDKPSDQNSASNTASKTEKKETKKWRKASQSAIKRFGSQICNIDRVDAQTLTKDRFEEEYRYKKPVIVRFPNGAKDWTNPKKWTLNSLKREYGLWSVLSGNSREIVRRGGNGDVQTSFTEYVDGLMDNKDEGGEPFYIFDRAFYNDSSLPRTLKPPKYFQIKDGIDDSIFFLGASGSGVTFHKHADAWNGVIYGQKRWFLYPSSHTPPGGVYPGFTQIEWYDIVYPNLAEDDQPMECIQQAGEILYLPEGTYHGTINLGDTVAIGIQKKDATIETEKLFYDELQVERQYRDNRVTLLQKKVEIYERLLELLPESTEVLMKSGQIYSDSGRVDEGLTNTQAAIDRDPYFIIAKLNKAKTLMQMQRGEEAEEILKELLNINPKLWDIHATYGDFLMSQKRPKEAAVMFREGTKLKPDLLPFWIHLRYAQEASGDREGMMETSKKIQELEDKSKAQRGGQ
ncbi:hypothetical protein FSP39_006556 [Pinctada imbricata]|uniref:JmjC domain-containing protein n=1 Tax=Pinctada imbricata TaxID=66713 RepID=A0AA88YBH8_PINIB|nr:hypothetical protein FSP39_006556 [Pinctada imbricata]